MIDQKCIYAICKWQLRRGYQTIMSVDLADPSYLVLNQGFYLQDKIGVLLLLALGGVAYTQSRSQISKEQKAASSLRQQVCTLIIG